jgi:hypothetical protein
MDDDFFEQEVSTAWDRDMGQSLRWSKPSDQLHNWHDAL